MLQRQSYLESCQELRHLGFAPAFSRGERLARGFADLGFEEFYWLDADRMVSLFTGRVVAAVEGDRQHLFRVPSCDELVAELARLGAAVAALEFREQRTWRLTLAGGPAEESRSFESDGLNEVLLAGLLELLRSAASLEVAENREQGNR